MATGSHLPQSEQCPYFRNAGIPRNENELWLPSAVCEVNERLGEERDGSLSIRLKGMIPL